MRLHRLWIVFLLLGLAAMPRLHAQAGGSPYSVTVPVTDTSDEQRDQAFSTALAQVMARVAGGQDLRSNPGYAEALGSASSLVQKFQYQRAATGLVLDVDFAPASVRRLIGKLGVDSQGSARRSEIQGVVTEQVDAAREGEAGVNLDEEMTNLLTYQRGYEAASRVLTTINSMLDQLINRTGLVGR